jgi:DNA-binding NtrC family response regulator
MKTHARESRDTILLIDDDQFIAGSLKQFLLANRWEVDVAVDADAAEGLMRSRSYSVVLVDPYLTGTLNEDRGALISATRELQPDAALIVLSGYRSSEMERAAADCHAAAMLSKPQSVIALNEVITSSAGKRRVNL